MVWANTDTSTAPAATCSSALERARMQIPSHCHWPGDNSTHEGSVGKAGPFVSLLLTSFRAQLERTWWHQALSPASSGPLQTLQCSPEGQSSFHLPGASIWVEFGSPRHGLPPASFHPTSTPPSLQFSGWEAHPPWWAERNWGPCAAAYMALPLAAQRDAHQMWSSGICVK